MTRRKRTVQPITINIDPEMLIQHSRDREDNFLDQMLSMAGTGSHGFDSLGIPDFGAAMAIESLVKQEEMILRMEYPSVHPKHHAEEMARYVTMRQKIEKTLGASFNQHYERGRESHNKCARLNLDSHKGFVYTWVLPKFNADGTHDPVGDRDFPFGHYPVKK